jgi:4-amino-4-deoxy-L-arabinose transferase-like glycosyltransferase
MALKEAVGTTTRRDRTRHDDRIAVEVGSRKSRVNARELWPLWLFAFLLFFRLDAAPLYILDEVKNAQCAREMLQRGDPVVPTFNGELRTDKPVLHYLFMMASYSMFGFSPFAARFFSSFFGLLALTVTYVSARRFINRQTATWVAAVLALSTHWTFEFRLAVPDPYLIAFTTVGLTSGYAWLEGQGRGYLYLSSLSLALAVLTKGPVALALPGLCLLSWSLLGGSWKRWRLTDIATASLLLLAVVLPWYLAVHEATTGEWTRGFFIRHNLDRFSGPMEGHGGSFALPVVFLAAGMLPSSVIALHAFRIRSVLLKEPFVRFSLLVVCAHLIVYGVSATKLPHYAMPAYPFAAVILGRCLRLSTAGHAHRFPKYIVAIPMGLLWLFPVAGYMALASEMDLADLKWVSLWLLAGPLLASTLLLSRRAGISMHPLLPVSAGWLVFNLVGLHLAYPLVYSRNPVARTKELVSAAPRMAAYGMYNPAFNIVLDDPIIRFRDRDSLLAWMDANPGALVVSRKGMSDTLKDSGLRVLAEQKDLFEKPTSVILGR